MPQIIQIDNNLRAGANVAGSIGNFQTDRINEADARAAEQQRTSQLSAVLQDQRYREHTAAVAASALAGQQTRSTIADDRNQNRLDVATVNQAGANDRSAAGIAGRQKVSDDRIESQWGIAGMKEDDDLYQNELNLKYKYDDLKTRQGISAAAAKATAEYHAAQTQQQQRAAADRYQHSLEMEAIRSNLKNVRMRRAAAMSALRANAIATGAAVTPEAMAGAAAPFDREAADAIRALNAKAAEAMQQQERQQLQQVQPQPSFYPGEGDPTDPATQQQQPQQQGQPVRVNTREEALSLPSGTVFVTPDNQVKVRP